MSKDKKTDQKEVVSETEELQNEIIDLKNKLMRSLADYQNLQRQTANQIEMMRLSSLSEILKGMSELADDLNLAIASLEEDKRAGLQGISAKLQKLILEQGCELINPNPDDDFDSATMEVITQTNTDDKNKNNKVAQTVSIGLKYGERILKPARVITYKSA